MIAALQDGWYKGPVAAAAGRALKTPMKRMGLICCLGALTLCGCAHQYVIKLSNGMKITTASKPELKGGHYYFKDATGQVNVVPQSRVIEIEPASMAQDEDKFTPAKPKTSHWWKFW